MIPIQVQILLILIADEDVADLIGTKIYPLRIPQGGTLPAVVYQQVANAPINSMDGDSGLDNIRMQVTCWAGTYSDAVDLAAAVRNAIISAPSLKAVTAAGPFDIEDQETKSYGIIIDFYIWSSFTLGALAVLSTFERVEFSGSTVTTEVSLPTAIPVNGFYLVSLNGRIGQESVEFTLNAARNKITFLTPLVGGSYKDEGIIIYQTIAGAQFGRVDFGGDGVTTEINLPAAIVADGFYLITLNGRIAKEGTTYSINAARNKITFLTPLAGGADKDEGIIIFQTA